MFQYITIYYNCITSFTSVCEIFFTGCGIENVDLVFMIDTSGSIRDDMLDVDPFQLMLQFVKETVQQFPIGLQDSLVGVIVFSNDATLHFNVQAHTDIAALFTAIDNLPYIGGTTNTAAALELLLNSAQNGEMGLRPGYPHIAILITDGVSTVRAAETVPFAERVRASNIFQSLLVVGITPQVNVNELNAIAGDPSHVFYSMTFVDLVQLHEALSHTLCDRKLILLNYNAIGIAFAVVIQYHYKISNFCSFFKNAITSDISCPQMLMPRQ